MGKLKIWVIFLELGKHSKWTSFYKRLLCYTAFCSEERQKEANKGEKQSKIMMNSSGFIATCLRVHTFLINLPNVVGYFYETKECLSYFSNFTKG